MAHHEQMTYSNSHSAMAARGGWNMAAYSSGSIAGAVHLHHLQCLLRVLSCLHMGKIVQPSFLQRN